MQCLADLSVCLARSGVNPGLAGFIELLLGAAVIGTFPLLLVIFLIYVERRFAARIQDRLGPNRVGPFGLLQSFADAIKMVIKEDITPTGADRVIYNIAPVLAAAAVVLMWAAIPLSPTIIGSDLEIGVVYVLTVASVGTLAIVMAGWSSNNKYALLGSFRAVAQLVSYEVPLLLSVLIPVLLAGTLSMQGIVQAQGGIWFAVVAPVSLLLFYISAQAETGRAPFDLLEAESELVAGFNVEYSGMKFGLFYVAEFLHVFTNAVLMAVLFFGGWQGPGVNTVPALGIFYLMFKASFIYLSALLLRNSVPRVRIDQLMNFNWKFLVPISIVNLVVMALLLKVVQTLRWWTEPAAMSFLQTLPAALVLLVGNIALAVGILTVLRNQGREERQRLAAASARRTNDVRATAAAGR